MGKKKNNKVYSIERQLARGPVDLPFLALTLLLLGIGLVMLLSASYPSGYYKNQQPYETFMKQFGFALLGIVAMYLVSRFDYQRWRGLSPVVLVLAVVLLLLVLVPGLGKKANGALRWLKIPGLPQFQPSEMAKFSVILFFSARLSKRKPQGKKPYSNRKLRGRALNKLHESGFLELLPYGGVLLLFIGLLSKQPHMSATILIMVVGASILFAAGVNWKWFLTAGILVVGLLVVMILTTSYMTSRVEMWLDPWVDPLGKGMQAIQSLLAIGSGGLLGLGLGNSRQKYMYLPEEHNDFIFSIICEELGLLGAGLILIFFALLVIRGYWLALHARDRFGSLMIVGVITLLAFQVFLNVAVVTNFMPVTGISLPFFSSGGTALLIQMAEMGLVLAVSRQIPAQKSD